jgi:ABC-type uncharacterized transport system substrate-binding protein
MRALVGVLAVALLCGAFATRAAAHPHVWIMFEATVIHEKGAFVGVRYKWTFDEFYTAMAIEGLDKNNDGKLDREELAELANFYVTGLKEYSYFTFPALAGHKLQLGEPKDIWLEYKDNILSLNFTVPFAQPVLTDAKGFAFSVYDPSFYIALDISKLLRNEAELLKSAVPDQAAPVRSRPAVARTEPSGLKLNGIQLDTAKRLRGLATWNPSLS